MLSRGATGAGRDVNADGDQAAAAAGVHSPIDAADPADPADPADLAAAIDTTGAIGPAAAEALLQVHRALTGTPARAVSMCWPQPLQVGLLQWLQVIFWHMVLVPSP